MGKSEKLYNFIVDMMINQTYFGRVNENPSPLSVSLYGEDEWVFSYIRLPNGRTINGVPIGKGTSERLNDYFNTLFMLINPSTGESYRDMQKKEIAFGRQYGLTDDEVVMVFDRYFKKLSEYIVDNYS